MGTVFFGSYVTRGTHFYNAGGPTHTQAEQVNWLKGLENNTSSGPADVRAVNSAGPISIRPGYKKTVYFALVGGSTLAEMVANRNAAAAHYASLTGAAASLTEQVGTVIPNAASRASNAKVEKSF